MTDLGALVAAARDEASAGASSVVVAPGRPHVAIRTNSRWFAVPAVDVVEVITLPAVTRVPAAPSHVLGVTLVRTRLVTVIDLEQLVAARPTPRLERGRVVVVRADAVELGVVAMSTRGLVELPEGGGDAAPPERPSWIAREVGLDEQRLAIVDVAALVAWVGRGARP